MKYRFMTASLWRDLTRARQSEWGDTVTRASRNEAGAVRETDPERPVVLSFGARRRRSSSSSSFPLAPRASLVLFLALLSGLLLAHVPRSALAASSLHVAAPDPLAIIDAATYDAEARQRLGGGLAGWEEVEDGRLRFRAVTRIEGGPRTEATALFAPVADSSELQPIRQESRSYDSSGERVGTLIIDHEARHSTCERRDEAPVSIELPKGDRVANVIVGAAMRDLLGEDDRATSELQLVVCRFGGRVLDARARIVDTFRWDGREIVEIRLGADLGPLLGGLLGPFLPEIPMWFDQQRNLWLGHRIPLHPQAPTVTVLRAEVAARLAPRLPR